MPLFTPEELEELRIADAEIDEEFHETMDEIRESRSRDRAAKIDRMDNHGKKIAAQRAAYREASREKIAAQQAAYYEANREKIAAQRAAYYEANREKYNAYMREYKRAHRKTAAGAQNRTAVQEKEPFHIIHERIRKIKVIEHGQRYPILL